MELYHAGHRHFQDLFDTRRLADRTEQRIVVAEIDDEDRQFIESRDMFFLATVDANGMPNCSYNGGAPGLVRVVDPRTIAFPIYDGNGMYLPMGNVRDRVHVGLLFIDWERPNRLRLNGDAHIVDDDPLLSHYLEAQFIVRVSVRQLFPNCGRYIHKLKLVERSPFVPAASHTTPVPDWKKQEQFAAALAATDPAR